MHKESGQDHRSDPARMAGREANFDDEIPWTEDDILRLHGLLLEKSLHDLFENYEDRGQQFKKAVRSL